MPRRYLKLPLNEAQCDAERGTGGSVKDILSCLKQHRKPPLTQIQPQVAYTFSPSLLCSAVCGTLCGLFSSSSSCSSLSSSCCVMHYLCRICPTTARERQPCGRKLTIWHHDKRALATMMHACQSPDRLPTPTQCHSHSHSHSVAQPQPRLRGSPFSFLCLVSDLSACTLQSVIAWLAAPLLHG